MSTPANFNGARPVIDVNDTAMLLIDHQSGLFQTVQDMPFTTLRRLAGAPLRELRHAQQPPAQHWPLQVGLRLR